MLNFRTGVRDLSEGKVVNEGSPRFQLEIVTPRTTIGAGLAMMVVFLESAGL
jgi:hypothetical protein